MKGLGLALKIAGTDRSGLDTTKALGRDRRDTHRVRNSASAKLGGGLENLGTTRDLGRAIGSDRSGNERRCE